MQSIPVRLPDKQLELAKWLALITMVVDHAGFLFSDKVDYLAWRAIGRLCWPLIAWIVAMRLYAAPERTWGYLKRLLPWAVIAQIPYAFLFNLNHAENGVLMPQPWYAQFNIFCTIALGCVVFMLLERWEKATNTEKMLLVLGITVSVCLGLKVDYNTLGVICIPVIALLARQSLVAAALACGLLGSACNILILAEDGLLAKYWIMAVTPWLCSLIALFCLKVLVPLPRLPRWFFYAFYPVHFIALLALRVAMDWDKVQAQLQQGGTP